MQVFQGHRDSHFQEDACYFFSILFIIFFQFYPFLSSFCIVRWPFMAKLAINGIELKIELNAMENGLIAYEDKVPNNCTGNKLR